MDKAHFVVPLADLERGTKSVTWTVSEGWLRQALRDTEASPRRDGSLELELSKNGRQVMVRGRLEVALSMPCVRTLEPVDVDLNPDVFLMLHPAPEAAAPASPARGKRDAAHKKTRAEATPHPGKKRPGANWDEDPELSPEQAAEDTYDGEKIELDRFIREFILLELPMTPMQKGLHEEPEPAIARTPADRGGAESPVDPRLAPLAAIADRLRQKKE